MEFSLVRRQHDHRRSRAVGLRCVRRLTRRPASRAYLRQAVHQLNLALPPQLRLTVEQNRLALADEVAQGFQSLLFESDPAQAHRLAGREALSAIEEVLARDEGDYLPDRSSEWVEERRWALSRQTAEALSSAAELALRPHQYGDAARLCDQVTAIDPLREVAWRVRMRAANALGDDDGVLKASRAVRRRRPGSTRRPAQHARTAQRLQR